jgi:ketosteroid isomerase-like protein
VTRDELSAWVEAYELAWRTPGTAMLQQLFADDASYQTAPYVEPYRGLAAIEELWERERKGPDEQFTLEWEIVAVEGDTGVVRSEVRYEEPRQDFRNLWIVRFDRSGRCVAFEEWFFTPPGDRNLEAVTK